MSPNECKAPRMFLYFPYGDKEDREPVVLESWEKLQDRLDLHRGSAGDDEGGDKRVVYEVILVAKWRPVQVVKAQFELRDVENN